MTTPAYGCLVCIPGTFTCPDCRDFWERVRRFEFPEDEADQ